MRHAVSLRCAGGNSRRARATQATIVFGAAFFIAISVGFNSQLRGDETFTNASASRTTPANSKPKNLSQADRLAQADALVKQSLFYEISGSDDDRKRGLEAALNTSPNYSPAMWQSGHVEMNARWMKIDDVPQLARQNSDLGAYEKQRDRAADTLDGQLNLARWCSKRGLQEQARAHYNEVLEFDPENVEAHLQLGFKRVGNSWVARPQLDEMVSEAQRLARGLTKWLPRISAIRKGLLEGQGPGFESATKQFDELNDREALPALEYLLSAVDEKCATMLVEKLGQWSELPVTQAIVRQAIYSPWDSVRQLAATKLTPRPREDYVPKLLAAMYTPLSVQTVVVNEGGKLVSREVYAREGHSAWEVVMIDTAYVRDARRWGTPVQATADALSKMRENTAARLLIAAMQSANTEELNKRIINALSIATEQTTLVRPEDWWSWWDNQNETSYVKAKEASTQYESHYKVLQDQPHGAVVSAPPPPAPAVPPPSSTTTRGRRWCDGCFIAGTPVWTISGLKSVEKMRIGDLVLSQDANTGEIAYKPVLQTTVRQQADVFTVETGGPTLRCTGGHLFWVAGEGWTKARDLRSGQVLHCANGTLQVSLVTAENAPTHTHNLIVADFNTYFVGAEKIFTHDITERTPTQSLVPGLLRE